MFTYLFEGTGNTVRIGNKGFPQTEANKVQSIGISNIVKNPGVWLWLVFWAENWIEKGFL